MDNKDQPSNLPTFLVVILAALGLMAMPQSAATRNGSSQSSSSTTAAPISGGHTSNREAGDELDLLYPLWEYQCADESTSDSSHPRPEPPSHPLLAQTHRLRFLTVMVPDPDDTSMSHEFDSVVAAVERAAETQEFVMVGRDLPWATDEARKTQKEKGEGGQTFTLGGGPLSISVTPVDKPKPRPKRPGSILFEKPRPPADEADLLLVLLVPETPSAGVEKKSLLTALKLCEDYASYHECCPQCGDAPCSGEQICVVGPMYSGSFESLKRTIKSWARGSQVKLRRIKLTNGSALHQPNAERDPFWGIVHLKSTIISYAPLVNHLVRFLNACTYPIDKPRRVALLVEGGTPFGVQFDEPGLPDKNQEPPDIFVFPIGISRMRQESTARGIYAPREPIKLAATERLSLQSMTGNSGDRDLMPLYAPGAALVESELALSQILQAVERGGYTSVGIVASNDYDRIFLATKVREVCPDVRLNFTTSTTLYCHHDIVPYLRGSVVVSTYPLHLSNQWWTEVELKPSAPPLPVEPPPRRSHIAFSSDYAEGIYNATLVQLSDLGRQAGPPLLLDYGTATTSPGSATVPPVWISVVGERGLYPLRAEPLERTEVQGLYELHPRSKAETFATRLTPDWRVIFFMLALVVTAWSAWYLKAYGVPGGERTGGRLATRSGLRFAALASAAGLGLVLISGLPVWALGALYLHELNPTKVEIMAFAVATVATFSATAAWALALVRVLRAGVRPFLEEGSAGGGRRSRRKVQGDGVSSGAGGHEANDASLRLRDSLAHVLAAAIAVVIVALPAYAVGAVLGQGREAMIDGANLIATVERLGSLTCGVTPLLPFLMLGVAGAASALVTWLRMSMHGSRPEVSHIANHTADALAEVRRTLNAAWARARSPLLDGCRHDRLVRLAVTASVPALAWLVLKRPGAVESLPLLSAFLAAYLVTLLLVWLRLVELIGLWRLTTGFMRSLAHLPMVGAFDRLPTRAVIAKHGGGPWASAAVDQFDDSERLILLQLHCLTANLGPLSERLALLASPARVDQLAKLGKSAAPRSGHAPGKGHSWCDWGDVVDLLVPFVEGFWERRSISTVFEVGSGDRDFWPGLDEKPRREPHKAEAHDMPKDDADERYAPAGAPEAPWGATTQVAKVPDARRRAARESDNALKTWLGHVEDLIALVLCRELNRLRRDCSYLTTGVVVGLIGLALSVASYPFQPQGRLLQILVPLALITFSAVVTMAVQTSRDEVVSRMTHTTPNRVTYDRDFLVTLVTYGLPLVTLLFTLSYGLSDLIRAWFEPLFR